MSRRNGHSGPHKKRTSSKGATKQALAANGPSDVIRLRFQGDVVELRPTVEEPFGLLTAKEYEAWFGSISDVKTSMRIDNATLKMRRGLFGDWKDVGDGILETRLDFGPGYRIYFARHGNTIVILLGGGDKSSQQKDIVDAAALWKRLKDGITQV
jgi:putative addiction module killer protein